MPITDGLALDLDDLTRQRETLRRSGRLRASHWLIVAASVLITVFAWYTSQSLLEQRAEQRFQREIGRVIDLVGERMKHYEDALLSSASTLEVRDDEVTHAQWRRYAGRLNLTERYPGLNGIGVIFHVDTDRIEPFVARMRRERPAFRLHPETSLDVHLPIAYIEPEPLNAAAVGLDVAFERNRRVAALDARRLGTTRISGSIELVQDADKTPGFLFYAPYYAAGDDHPLDGPSAPVRRESLFRGLVYAPIVVKTLVAGTLGLRDRDLTFSIHDGDTVLYDELDGEEADPSGTAPLATRTLELYGRTWTFRFRDRGVAGGGAGGVNQPTVVLLSGLAVDAMLLGLFATMSRSNRRMLGLAERMTDNLSEHARVLAESNDELRHYAHIVSHDLKTPIRGIQDLAGFIREDLGDYLIDDGANPDVAENLDLLDRQAARGQALIDGVLDYASVGLLEGRPSVVDTGELVGTIGHALGLRADQVVAASELPVFRTHAARLAQVLERLIGNAFKYHHDRARMQVRVVAVREDDVYRFAVTDDGPGIDPRYHERIFEPFTTLGSATTPDEDGSGIGLSIVRKSVELFGGRVSVESAVDRGTTFRFDWPVESARLATPETLP